MACDRLLPAWPWSGLYAPLANFHAPHALAPLLRPYGPLDGRLRGFLRSRVCGRALESELGEGVLLVTVVVAAVVRVVFRFGHVGRFVAAGRVHLEDEGFAGSGSLVKCDVPGAPLPFAPAYGFHVDVTDVVCDPRLRDHNAGRLVVVEADGSVGARLRVTSEPVAGCIVVEPFVASAGGEDGAHHAVLDVRGDGRVRVGVVTVVDHGQQPLSWGDWCFFLLRL